jgi:hypothetical protein
MATKSPWQDRVDPGEFYFSMRVAYIHVGSDKTGSTTLQKYFFDNRDKLLKNHSIYFPEPFEAGNHSYLASYFESSPSTYIHGHNLGRSDEQCRISDKKFFEVLQKNIASSSCSKLIISYEGFMWSSEEALYKIHQFLHHFFNKVVLICYARPPLSYAVSAYAQQIYSGIYPSEPAITKWGEVLPRFWRVFGRENVILRCFSKNILKDGNIIPDFLRTIDLNTPLDHSRLVHENTSMSEEGANLGKSIIRVLAQRKASLFPIKFSNNFGKMLKQIKGLDVQLDTTWVENLKKISAPHSKIVSEALGFAIEDHDEKYYYDNRNEGIAFSNYDIIANKLVDLYIASLERASPPKYTLTPPPASPRLEKENNIFYFSAGKLFNISVNIDYNSPQSHKERNETGSKKIQFHWLDVEWNILEGASQVVTSVLEKSSDPGKTTFEIALKAPERPGIYHLALSPAGIGTDSSLSDWKITPSIFDIEVTSEPP